MPKRESSGGASSPDGRWRQTDDRADFGVTQVSPGSLPTPPVDPDLRHSIPATLFETPFDTTEETHPKLKLQAVNPGFGKGPARSKLDHIYFNCADSSPDNRHWD